MKLEELPKSTSEVRKFSDGNTLLTLWFDGLNCRSMEVVFDILGNETVLFCSNKKQHFYNTRKEVRYGYELSEVAVNFQNLPSSEAIIFLSFLLELFNVFFLCIFFFKNSFRGDNKSFKC